MRNKWFISFSVVLGVFAAIAHCTNIDRCEVGADKCLCRKNDQCDKGLVCIKDKALISEVDVVQEDVEEGGICLQVTCLETCESSNNDVCDDNGEDSDNDSCNWGTDCKDCGKRIGEPPGNPRCSDSCKDSGDGKCDDGGKGSEYTNCEWGTDCSDCGPRYGNPPICLETCDTSKNRFCDDGGENADYFTCDWGTDCRDCGPRYGDPPTR